MLPRRHFARHQFTENSSSARDVAFEVLSVYKNRGQFVSKLLEQAEKRATRFSPAERPLAVELINGVVRREATLDALISGQVQRPRHRIEGELWTLLQLGAYQLAFLTAVPAYAAVNETVALAQRVGRRGWSGFVNGVLRSLERSLMSEFVASPSADAFPLADGRYRRATRPFFPEPSVDPVGYIAGAFSFPRWLVERWTERFRFDELCAMGFWFDKPAPMSLRVNLLKADRTEVLQSLASIGVNAGPGALPESISLEGTLRVDSLPGFSEGHFSVQDESAMQAVDLLAPQKGETILDLCAAPGAKTTHLAERMENSGCVIATDIRQDRLARIDENCKRLGISTVKTALMSPRGDEIPPGPFDAVLVDVPCSNTGVLGKRPEARWRITAAEITDLSARQRMLLDAAVRRVRPEGRIVYSSCSIEPEENEQLVRSILQSAQGIRLVEERRHFPGQPADGGYQALLRRNE